jgi:hypothetical protein
MVTLLLNVPSEADFTATVIVHAPTASEAFENDTLPDPAVAVTVPPQLLVTLGVAATTKPAGNVSVKLPSTATILGFVMLNVRVLVAFTATVVGLKLLVICSGARIVMLAVTVAWSTVASA